MDILIPSTEIAAKIKETAVQISKDYCNRHLTVVLIMKGALCLTADLIRELSTSLPFTLEFIQASSYGHRGMVQGDLVLSQASSLEVHGRDVLLVDDIFETGHTLLGALEHIQAFSPQSIKTLVLLSKPVPRKTDYRPDYVLFDIPNRFVVGYGLDYKERYRGLRDICAFPDDKPPF